MITRALAAPALAALLFAAPSVARAQDGLFGNIFSRVPGTEEPNVPASSPAVERDREARDLRRAYWERERARQSSAGRGLSRDASSQAIATR